MNLHRKAAKKAIWRTNRVLRRFDVELVAIPSDERVVHQDIQLTAGPLSYPDLRGIQAIAAPGHISMKEARHMGELVKETQPEEPLVEIGTLFGFSTLVLAMHKHDGQRLVTVDDYSWNPLGLSPRAHEVATSRVLDDAGAEIVRLDKEAFYRSFETRPGLFFCDADHTFESTLRDLSWARDEAKAGIICGHDYGRSEGVTEAVDQLGGPREVVDTLFVL